MTFQIGDRSYNGDQTLLLTHGLVTGLGSVAMIAQPELAQVCP
jgi:hypothetical protein